MKKAIMYIVVVLLLLSVFTCKKQDKQDITGEEAGDDTSFAITLNQALLDKYIKTLPPFIKKAKEEGKKVETVGAGWLFGEELITLLKDYGWNKPEEFGQVHTKVWAVTPWLIATSKMEGQSNEMQEMFLKQYEALFKSSGITEEEKELLIKNQDRLIAAIEEAEE
jgi:hypothetical protein